jgi:hypothetical protein
MLREEEERIQEHMSILDDDTCTCAFDADDAAAAKEANEIGAEQVRVILSLSLSLSPHTNTASATTTVWARLRAGAAAAVVDECASSVRR